MNIPIIQSLRELNTNVARLGQLRTDEHIMCCNVVTIVLIKIPYGFVTKNIFSLLSTPAQCLLCVTLCLLRLNIMIQNTLC